MANTFVTPTWVLKDVARVATNMLKFANNIERWYDDKYKAGGAKVGYTASGRLPQRFRTTKGQAFQPQAINDQTVPVTLTDQANIATSWSSADATMIVEDVRKRYVKPAGEQLANTIDYDGLTRMTPTVYQSVGTPGVVPTSRLTYLQAGAKLTNSAVPMSGRVAVLDPEAMVTLVQDTLTLFNPSGKVSENYREGQFGRDALGVAEWYQDQNRYVHTTGTFTSATPLTNGANQTGSALITDGWASGATTLKKGDVFTVAGVYAVNPQNYSSTGQLQQFVVTADTADVTGDIAALPISPAIVASGPLQNVTAAAADGAAITLIGAVAGTYAYTATVSRQSMVYHPEAFIMAMADLDADLPGAEVARVSDNELNISLRYVRQYSIGTDFKGSRIDCLYGFKEFRPDWACRVWG